MNLQFTLNRKSIYIIRGPEAINVLDIKYVTIEIGNLPIKDKQS